MIESKKPISYLVYAILSFLTLPFGFPEGLE
jgi:hypothetical protein